MALAYPDRVAQRRGAKAGSFRLASGSGALLNPADPLATEEFLAVAELDGDPRNARIFLAAPMTRAEIETVFASHIERIDLVAWDARDEAVSARRQERLGALALRDDPLPDPPRVAIRAALLDGLRELGLDALPWTREATTLRDRIRFVRRIEGGDWPDLSNATLLAGLSDWLGPFLEGITRRGQLGRLDLTAALKARLSWEQQRRLDALTPIHIVAPTDRLRRRRHTSAGGSHSGAVRPRRNAHGRRRASAAVAAPAVAGGPTTAGHPGSPGFLGDILRQRARGDARTLSEAPLA